MRVLVGLFRVVKRPWLPIGRTGRAFLAEREHLPRQDAPEGKSWSKAEHYRKGSPGGYPGEVRPRPVGRWYSTRSVLRMSKKALRPHNLRRVQHNLNGRGSRGLRRGRPVTTLPALRVVRPMSVKENGTGLRQAGRPRFVYQAMCRGIRPAGSVASATLRGPGNATAQAFD